MNAEDLFAAISGVESSRLARSEQFTNQSSYAEMEDSPMKKTNRGKLIRNLLVAAVVITLLSVTAYAAIQARIHLETTKYQNDKIVTGEPTGPYNVEIAFQRTSNEYLELGSVYPQAVPEGYKISFVSDSAMGMQNIVYTDNTGAEVLRFIAQLGSDGGQLGITNVNEEKSVTVQGVPGTLYRHSGGYQTLVWYNEEQGIGFTLFNEVPNLDLDLLSIAESVGPGEPLIPTLAVGYDTALAELGDYRITALPEGFTETDFMASPLENGGDWYAYVRRWYGDKVTTDNTIYFEYEHFTLESDEPTNHPTEPVENTPETIIRYYGGEEPATIQGMPGAVEKGRVIWVDWDAQVVFEIWASGRSSQEILALAESVQRFN